MRSVTASCQTPLPQPFPVSEEQMVGILREADKDPVAQVAKRHGVSEQTIYG